MEHDEQEIREFVSTWWEATEVGDIDTILSLMSEDAVFLVAGQPVMRMNDFAAAARARPGEEAPNFDGTSEIQEIKVFGDRAFMWTKLTIRVATAGGGESVKRSGNTLSIPKREREWKMDPGARCQYAGYSVAGRRVTPNRAMESNG